MEKYRTSVNGKLVMLTFQNIYTYQDDYSLMKNRYFMCYFSFMMMLESTFGEILLNEKGNPKIFNDKQEAFDFAQTYIKKQFML